MTLLLLTGRREAGRGWCDVDSAASDGQVGGDWDRGGRSGVWWVDGQGKGKDRKGKEMGPGRAGKRRKR